jgi:hypothetical protein
MRGDRLNDPGGGYVLNQTGWDCVLGNASSVSNYGFEDAVIRFGSLRWVIPIQAAVAMNSLDKRCTKTGGSFGFA